ncbi:MAG: hypothetical protein COB67_05445 [SAR324 cluster bacterium]|uniref:SiaC family regulatory phosphoprotein domain-containing protein n=1 Tax=SAR324 cluster bacterium TaxID=2024889 RepID=A0A2A4T6V9_9DELT|nr:MAG: hypothetical protein COB67_05445 [SAR324 cluster bacterium]
MEDFLIEATAHTPNVRFDSTCNSFEITGESYPENTALFYQPVFEFIERLLQQLGEKEVVFNVQLFYFNSSSSKVLMDLFDLLDEASKEGKRIIVNWIYDEEDEDTMEYGEEFQADSSSLHFNLVEKNL